MSSSSYSASDLTRLLPFLLPLFVPWTVVLVPGSVDFVFAWGLLNTHPLHVVTVTDYLYVHTRGLPPRLVAWPVATLLYCAAVVSGASAVVDRQDPRVTGGLLVIAAVSVLWFSIGIDTHAGGRAIPVGTVVLLGVAWWTYDGANAHGRVTP